jgi:hypothetical protein
MADYRTIGKDQLSAKISRAKALAIFSATMNRERRTLNESSTTNEKGGKAR